MKAIAYIRVSTQDQVNEGVSLDNQRQRIETYCQYKGFDLVGFVADEGISGGKNKARPGFIELLNQIESGDIDVIVLYSLERISRDMLTLLALERLLDERDIELHTVEGMIDTATPDGFMSFAMKSFLGEMERRQVKYRTKRAMEYKKAQGSVVGSVPYGFRREGDTLVSDPGEQVVMEIANRLYKEGRKLGDICKDLQDMEKKTRNGKPFTPQQVKRILESYRETFHKQNSRLGQNIRSFIEAIA